MVKSACTRKNMPAFLLAGILLVRTAPAVALYAFTGSAVLNAFEFDPLLYLGGARSILTNGLNEFPFFAPLNFSFIAGLLHLGSGTDLVPVLATAFVGWLGIVALYGMARELFDETAACFTAIFAGLYPNLVFYGINLYPESLAIFFITSSFFLLVKYFKGGRLRYAVCAGILWGFASHTRGGLHLFSAGMCLAIILDAGHKTWTGWLKPVCLLLGSIYCVIFILGLLFAQFDEGVALNSQSGMGSVLHGANRIANCNQDYGVVRGALVENVYAAGDAWPEGVQVYSDELMEQDALTIMAVFFAFVMEDPLAYLRSGFERLSFLWSPNQLIIKYIKLRGYYRSPVAADALCLFLSLVFIAVLCLGSLGFAFSRDTFRPLFVLFFLFYALLIFFTVGNAKLRLPLMPFIMLYAGYFCSSAIDRSLMLKKRSAAFAGLLCGMIMLNGVYRYQDIAISPGEFIVRQVETSAGLGFPKTALFLLEKNKSFQHYTEHQKKRLDSIERRLHEGGYQ